jgi:signal recognition particle subunit SRP54
MDEMQSLKKILTPQEVLFVADSMTGQDAVHSADDFPKLTLTGVVLTRWTVTPVAAPRSPSATSPASPSSSSASARIRRASEPFHPDRIVGRILGMGDILSLIEKADATLDKKKSEAFAAKALSHEASRSRISAISCVR